MTKAILTSALVIAELILLSNACIAEQQIKESGSIGNLYQVSNSNNMQFTSKLSFKQRKEYEQLMSLTKSFALSLKFLPQIFEPEKESYFEALNWLIKIFVFISLFPLALLLFYILMRFVFKKCRGPEKAKEITPLYKLTTWILLAVGVIGMLVLSIFILDASKKAKDGFNAPLERYSQNINVVQNSAKPLIDLFNLIHPHLSTTTVVDKDYFNDLSDTLTNYAQYSNDIISKAIRDESNRDIVANLFCYIYLVMLIISIVAFWRRWKKVCLVLSLITFLTISTLIIIEGYNAKFYFNSNNICSSVYASMYQNQFPVTGTQIGYYFNCFDKEIKAKLFALNYLIEEAKSNVRKTDSELYQNISTKQSEYLNNFLQCDRVYSALPDFEEQFCYQGIDLLNSILLYYPWMFILVFIFGISLNRLEIHIWKNKLDIKAILENSIIIY